MGKGVRRGHHGTVEVFERGVALALPLVILCGMMGLIAAQTVACISWRQPTSTDLQREPLFK
jgi:hypothetical protein